MKVDEQNTSGGWEPHSLEQGGRVQLMASREPEESGPVATNNNLNCIQGDGKTDKSGGICFY